MTTELLDQPTTPAADELTSLTLAETPSGIPEADLDRCVARLQAESEKPEGYVDGYRIGLDWALTTASTSDLRNVAITTRYDGYPSGPRGIAKMVINRDATWTTIERFWLNSVGLTPAQVQQFIGSEWYSGDQSHAFSCGFRAAVERVWRAVRDRI
jgi:hypothetical protein